MLAISNLFHMAFTHLLFFNLFSDALCFFLISVLTFKIVRYLKCMHCGDSMYIDVVKDSPNWLIDDMRHLTYLSFLFW